MQRGGRSRGTPGGCRACRGARNLLSRPLRAAAARHFPGTLTVVLVSNSRFFLDIASDCPASDTVNHSLSFISDGNVLALHRLLWNNQEKIGQYLSSNRYGCAGVLKKGVSC